MTRERTTSGDGKDPSYSKIYDRLLSSARQRSSSIAGRSGRSLEEEADADRGRVLFSAPFRRLQNKAQVFSLETNAAVRSRLTHSLEVSSIGRYVAQQAIKSFNKRDARALGISGKERPFITFVETACLLHDIGNPPFGHFGEITIADWFYQRSKQLEPDHIAGESKHLWQGHFSDFLGFDGNPQGFRVFTKLQPTESTDLCGLNLTAATMAAALKYPWSSAELAERRERKAGFFLTESESLRWLQKTLGLSPGVRHPLVFLMEAADDIAYCLSDIEDGIEKGLISGRDFGSTLAERLASTEMESYDSDSQSDFGIMLAALEMVKNSEFLKNGEKTIRLTALQDFRSALIRILARHSGIAFSRQHDQILTGRATSLLKGNSILKEIKRFAEDSLYSSAIVRNMEITAHSVLFGILDSYLPIMSCERDRFVRMLGGQPTDGNNRRITQECGLVARLGKKQVSVYTEEVRRSDLATVNNPGNRIVMERVHRIRLILDYISGMTDEYALRSFQLISGQRVSV